MAEKNMEGKTAVNMSSRKKAKCYMCQAEINDKVHSLLTQGADNQEADNFNTVRQITVTNSEGDVLFQMTGKMAITADTADNKLEIIVEIPY